MARKVGLPDRARSKFSSEWVGGSGQTAAGAVFSEYSVSHPFGKGNFSTRVRLYAGVRRVDIETQVLNNDSYVRYRVLFPTTIQNGKRTDEIPFGAIERPQAQEFPAQNWIDYGDGAHGLALLGDCSSQPPPSSPYRFTRLVCSASRTAIRACCAE